MSISSKGYQISAWILIIFLLIISSVFALTPGGVDTLTTDSTGRKAPENGTQVSAIAGNVTQLLITGTSVTQMWQGYYGNISGAIILADADNNVFYNWSASSPEGEIYASMNGSIDWTRIECYNVTAAKTTSNFDTNNAQKNGYLNLSELEETSLGGTILDVDGIDETFGTKFTGTFYVGNKRIDTGEDCSQVTTFVNNASQSQNFTEVILIQDNGTTDWFNSTCRESASPRCGDDGKDNAIEDLVWTTIIEKGGSVGFNDKIWDFQMLVPENGHNGDTEVSQYYFYIEIS